MPQPKTVGDAVIEARRLGFPIDKIDESFKRAFGLSLRDVKPDTPIPPPRPQASPPTKSRYDNPAAFGLTDEQREALDTPATTVRAEHVSRPLKWAAGVATGAAGLAAGAAKQLMDVDPTARLREASTQAIGGPGAAEYVAESKRRRDEGMAKIREAKQANRELRQKRASEPTQETVLQDLGDVVGGAGHMMVGQLLNMEGPRGENPIDTAKRRFGQGQEMAAGMIGATSDQAEGLLDPPSTNTLRTQPVSTALNAMPIGKGLFKGGKAAATAAAKSGMPVVSTLGKLGERGFQAAADAGQTLHGYATSAKEYINPFPGEEELLRRAEDAGMPDEAVNVFGKANTPEQAVREFHPLAVKAAPYVRSGMKIAKGAALGALLGDTVVGPVVGAVGGAAIPAALEAFKHLAPVEYAKKRAAYMRQVADPSTQPTPEATETTRHIIERPVEVGAEVNDLAREAAGQYRQGRVEFAPAEEQQTVLAPSKFREKLQPHEIVDAPKTMREKFVAAVTRSEGKPAIALAPPHEAELGRLEAGERAQGLARFIDATEAEEGKLAPDERRELKKKATEVNIEGAKFENKERLASVRAHVEKLAESKRTVLAALREDLDAKLEAIRNDLEKEREANIAKAKAVPARQGRTAAWDEAKKANTAAFERAKELAKKEREAHAAQVKEMGEHVKKAARDAWENYRVEKEDAWNVAKAAAADARDKYALKSPDLKTELNDMKHGQPDWTRGLDVEAGKAEVGEGSVARLRTTNPAIDEVIHRAWQTMNEAGQNVPKHWFQRVFTSVMDHEAMGLLYTPRFRAILAQDIAKDLQIPKERLGSFNLELDNKLVEINRDLFGPNPKSVDFVLPDGSTVRLEDYVQHAMQRMDKMGDIRNAVMADAMENIGKMLRIQAEDSHLVSAARGELYRFVAPPAHGERLNPQGVTDESTYFANVMQRSVVGREALPLAVPYDPQKAARSLRTLAAQNDVPNGATAASALQMADYLETLRPASQIVKEYMNEKKLRGEIEQVGDGIWLTPGMDAVLSARVNLLRVARSLDWLDKALAQFKLSMTAYRLKTWTNNFGSNMVYDFVAEGLEPLTILSQAVEEASNLHKFMTGELNPQAADARMYHALSRAGLGNLANLATEVEALRAMSSPHGQVSAALHHASELAKKGYNLGDMPFKVRKAVRNYRAVMADLDTLKPGEWARIKLTGESAVDLQRVGETWKANGRGINQQQLADLVGRASVRLANDSFINTNHAPIWLQKLRSGRATAIASPFLSWGWGALELPGKPGLLSHALEFGAGAVLDTNNPTILARNAVNAWMVGARRQALLAATRAELDPNRDAIREMLPYEWGNMGAVDVSPSSSDKYAVNMHDFSPMNPFSRAALIWRLGNAGVSMLYGAAASGAADKRNLADQQSDDPHRQRRAKYMLDFYTRKVSAQTLLDAMALSGNTFLDLARDVADASDPRGHRSAEDVMTKFALNMMGGTVTDTGRMAAAMVNPLSPDRPYLWLAGRPEDMGVVAVQGLIGVGYQDKELLGDKGKMQAYLSRVNVALHGAIERDYQDRLQKLGRWKDNPERQAELERIKRQYMDALKFVQVALAREKADKMKGAADFFKRSNISAEAIKNSADTKDDSFKELNSRLLGEPEKPVEPPAPSKYDQEAERQRLEQEQRKSLEE